MTELVTRSAGELVRAVRDGEVSAVEVLDAHLARIAERNPEINAIVLPRFDKAREEAVAADAGGANARCCRSRAPSSGRWAAGSLPMPRPVPIRKHRSRAAICGC